jgi:hypothetical protein
MIRAIVLAATIAALFTMWMDRPAPVKSVEVPYCVISEKVAGRDADGEWHTGWARGYGPCSRQDIYRQI